MSKVQKRSIWHAPFHFQQNRTFSGSPVPRKSGSSSSRKSALPRKSCRSTTTLPPTARLSPMPSLSTPERPPSSPNPPEKSIASRTSWTKIPLKFEVQGHCDSTDEGCVKNRRVELVRNKSTRVLAVEPATCNSVVSANRHVSGVQLVTRLWSFSRIGLYPGYTLLHVYSHFRVSACTPGLLAREGGDIGLRAQKRPQIVPGWWNNRPPGTKSHPKRARNVKLFVY